jgi:hypothetical protein
MEPERSLSQSPRLSRKDEIRRKAVEYGIVALLIWTPLPLGSVHEWSILVIEIAALVLFGLTLMMDRPPQRNPKLAARLKWPRYALTGFLAFLVLQIVPLPAFLVRIFSPQAAALRDAYVPSAAPAVTTLSLLPGRTLASGLEIAAYLMIGAVIVKTATHRRQFRRIVATLVAMGTFEAFYGLFEMLRRNPRLLLYKKELMLDSATGTFFNRNHFSGYLEMILPLAVGLILSRLDLLSGAPVKWRDRLARLAAKGAALNVLTGVGLVVMAIAILRSNSRSGAVILAVIFLLFFGMTAWQFAKARLRPGLAFKVLRISLLAILALSLYVGVDKMIGRFSLDRLLQDGRPQYWGKTMRMIGDFPLTGVGLGAYGQVYQAYDVMGMEYALVHAHNDYLEYLTELGIVGFVLLAGTVFFLFGDSIRTWAKRRHPEVKGLALGGIVSVLALFLHSLTDFNLRIPANALVLTVVLSLTFAVSYHRKT